MVLRSALPRGRGRRSRDGSCRTYMKLWWSALSGASRWLGFRGVGDLRDAILAIAHEWHVEAVAPWDAMRCDSLRCRREACERATPACKPLPCETMLDFA